MCYESLINECTDLFLGEIIRQVNYWDFRRILREVLTFILHGISFFLRTIFIIRFESFFRWITFITCLINLVITTASIFSHLFRIFYWLTPLPYLGRRNRVIIIWFFTLAMRSLLSFRFSFLFRRFHDLLRYFLDHLWKIFFHLSNLLICLLDGFLNSFFGTSQHPFLQVINSCALFNFTLLDFVWKLLFQIITTFTSAFLEQLNHRFFSLLFFFFGSCLFFS